METEKLGRLGALKPISAQEDTSRRRHFEPLIVLPREEAQRELVRIEVRISELREIQVDRLPEEEAREVLLEEAYLIRRSARIQFGSMPETRHDPSVHVGSYLFVGNVFGGELP